MRKIILFLAFFIAAAIIVLSLGELENIWTTLSHAHLRYVALAIVLLLVWTANDAGGYRTLYRLMGVDEKYRRLVLLSSAANFINVVAPSGGFGGVAVFVDDAGKRGLPRGLAAATGALYLFLDYAAFMVILTMGLAVYIRRNDLKAGEIGASVVMLGIVVSLGALIYIGAHSGERLGRILARISHSINRVLWPLTGKEYFHEAAAMEFGMEVSEGLSILRSRRRRVLLPFVFALNGKILQTLILALTFLAFGVKITPGMVVAGYASAYLFLIVSPTPYGIGVVETLLPVALSSLGIPWSEAVVVTLTYRGITFWLPLILGGISFRVLQHDG